MNISEIYNQLIVESKESRNRSKARKYLRDKGISDDKIKEIEKDFATNIPKLRDSHFKFSLGCARFYAEGKLKTGGATGKLNQTIDYINKSHLNEYDNDFNGLEYNTLIDRFKTDISRATKRERDEFSKKDFGKGQNYNIVKIESFEQAKQYSPYVNWCVVEGERAFNQYTRNGDGLFYFMLKDGYQNVERKPGPNAPKDEYGLSMIAISVDGVGNLNTSTTRWNHDNGGTDTMFTAEEISKLIGKSFYNVFKPRYTKEEYKQMIIDKGRKTYNGLFVEYNNKYYLVKNGDIDLDNYFDDVGVFYDGFAGVKIKNKGYNYINTNGEYLSDIWFDDVGNFYDGFAEVRINNRGNFINTNGEIISDIWFDYVYDFYNGFARVRINNKGYNFINTNGELLSDIWFVNAEIYSDGGLVRVEINGKGWYYIDKNGELFDENGNKVDLKTQK